MIHVIPCEECGRGMPGILHTKECGVGRYHLNELLKNYGHEPLTDKPDALALIADLLARLVRIEAMRGANDAITHAITHPITHPGWYESRYFKAEMPPREGER